MICFLILYDLFIIDFLIISIKKASQDLAISHINYKILLKYIFFNFKI